MGDNRITGDISTDPLAAKSRTVSADEVKIDYFKQKKITFCIKTSTYIWSSGQSWISKLFDTFSSYCIVTSDSVSSSLSLRYFQARI